MVDLIYKDESYAIIGACFEVYKDKGCGFVEPVYQECLEIELRHACIPFIEQHELALFYREQKLQHIYKPDFVCFDKIIVEIKAVTKLTDEHRAQVMNYLKATGYELGLLVNFGHFPRLEYERIVATKSKRL
ncbi:MAG TPA: GxxExxY protein [Pyrinomonadaceae bacterium]|nr:GxxExxY protein [Pyrinomonadaceae bacterium]